VSIATDIERLENILNEALMNEFEAQGHKMSGKLIQDIEYVVKQEVNKLTISGYMYPYANYLNAGVKADNIPFSPRGLGFAASGKGTSLFIKGLQNWVKIRMAISDEKKSLSVAFAIATSQKKYGMPTSASTFYSSTGKRTEFVSDAFKRDEDRITEVISDMAFNILTVKIDTLIDKWQLELNKS